MLVRRSLSFGNFEQILSDDICSPVEGSNDSNDCHQADRQEPSSPSNVCQAAIITEDSQCTAIKPHTSLKKTLSMIDLPDAGSDERDSAGSHSMGTKPHALLRGSQSMINLFDAGSDESESESHFCRAAPRRHTDHIFPNQEWVAAFSHNVVLASLLTPTRQIAFPQAASKHEDGNADQTPARGAKPQGRASKVGLFSRSKAGCTREALDRRLKREKKRIGEEDDTTLSACSSMQESDASIESAGDAPMHHAASTAATPLAATALTSLLSRRSLGALTPISLPSPASMSPPFPLSPVRRRSASSSCSPLSQNLPPLERSSEKIGMMEVAGMGRGVDGAKGAGRGFQMQASGCQSTTVPRYRRRTRAYSIHRHV